MPAVLAAYADDALSSCWPSPIPVARGYKVLTRWVPQYWPRSPTVNLRFELISAICDVEAQTVVVHYVAQAGGKAHAHVREIMRLRMDLQVQGEALHGVPPRRARYDGAAARRPARRRQPL